MQPRLLPSSSAPLDTPLSENDRTHRRTHHVDPSSYTDTRPLQPSEQKQREGPTFGGGDHGAAGYKVALHLQAQHLLKEPRGLGQQVRQRPNGAPKVALWLNHLY